MVNKDIILA